MRQPSPSDDLSKFVARCEGLSRNEIIAFAKREDQRAYKGRHRVTGRGSVARRQEIQKYADAMGALLNIIEYRGGAMLTRQQQAMQPLIDRLLREP